MVLENQNGIQLYSLIFVYILMQADTQFVNTHFYNVSVDVRDGHPVVEVDGDHVRNLHTLLQEHDEQFHDPFPGYKKISATDDHILPDSMQDPDEISKLHRILSQPPIKVRHKRAFIRLERTRPFPDGRVYFVFDKDFHPSRRPLVLKLMKELEKKIPCVHFIPAPPNIDSLKEAGGITITEKGKGCFASRLGYRGPGFKTIMNLSRKCGREVIFHELMHVLGAEHTQIRPDRDEYVSINFDNIKPEYLSNFKKIQSEINDKYDYEYDYSSAMHYGSRSFAINSNTPVIEVKGRDNVALRSRGHREMSDRDVESLRDWYGCGTRCPYNIGHCDEAAKSDALKPTGKKTAQKTPPLPFSSSLLRRIYGVLQNEHEIPSIILQSVKKILELDNDPILQMARRNEFIKSPIKCRIGPWYSWSDCNSAIKMRYRVRDVLLTRDYKDVVECPAAKDLMRVSECPTNSRSKRNVVPVFKQDNRTVIRENKTVQVIEGNTIELAVSNPDLLPVKWFNSSGREIESNNLTTITTTPAHNNVLTIPNSTVPRDNNTRYTSNTILKNTVYVVNWHVTVISVKEYLQHSLLQFLVDTLEVLVDEKKVADRN